MTMFDRAMLYVTAGAFWAHFIGVLIGRLV